MRETEQPQKTPAGGTFTTYADVLALWQSINADKSEHKGVGLKKEKNSTISLQFIDPVTGKRVARGCNCTFDYKGILDAKNKAIQLSRGLFTFAGSGDFWEWYDTTIAQKTKFTETLSTYGKIFATIEQRYYQGQHRNTGEQRSRSELSFVGSFERCYVTFFNRFPDLEKYLEWADFEHALYGYPDTPQGTKSFKDCLYVCKQIAELGNAQAILKKLEKIDGKQTIFKRGQSIDLDTFLAKHKEIEEASRRATQSNHVNAKLNWNWVIAMCVMYGLRPSEVAAGQNLTAPCTITCDKRNKPIFHSEFSPDKGDAFYSLSDSRNKDLALVIGDRTYFGATTKTGYRVCYPVPSRKLIDELNLRDVRLPLTQSKNPTAFSKNFSRWSKENYGISEAYAYRHLYNAVGQQYGLNQEDRALNMGHTTTANERHYKSRNKNNNKTRKALLTAKHPLPYDAAINELNHLGIDTEIVEVKLILKTIYRL